MIILRLLRKIFVRIMKNKILVPIIILITWAANYYLVFVHINEVALNAISAIDVVHLCFDYHSYLPPSGILIGVCELKNPSNINLKVSINANVIIEDIYEMNGFAEEKLILAGASAPSDRLELKIPLNSNATRMFISASLIEHDSGVIFGNYIINISFSGLIKIKANGPIFPIIIYKQFNQTEARGYNIYVIGTPTFNDTDGDSIHDGLEVLFYHTDPKKIDSDGGGVDDFNEIYTWNLNPNDPNDDIMFLNNIPNVEAKNWGFEDGKLNISTDDYVEISLRDPYIQWISKQTEIRWIINSDNKKTGRLFVDGEEIWKEYKRVNNSIEQPSYYFTHGKKGSCDTSSLANLVILKSIGLKAIKIIGKMPYKNKLWPHGWVEAYIDGDVYVINYNYLYPREGFYEKYNWKVPSHYDPNWHQT